MTEQFVCQQLRCFRVIYYWTASNTTSEIDFVLQKEYKVFSLEVKAKENLKAKSLKVAVEKFDNNNAIRTSMSKYKVEDWLINIPLYGIILFLKNQVTLKQNSIS